MPIKSLFSYFAEGIEDTFAKTPKVLYCIVLFSSDVY